MDNHDEWVAKIKEVVLSIADKLNADVLLYAGDIASPADRDLIELINDRSTRRKNVFFILTTDGGSADSAYRIARTLQQKYGKVVLFVDSFCKSAGTLIALGADEIVMADIAELGPLDVQLYKPDELSELTSGLTPLQALSTLQTEAFSTFEECFLKLRFRSGLQITTRTAADIAARLTIGLFKGVYAQLDPMRLGEYQRAMLIAQHYGTRIARKNLKDSALERLIADYPSHGFIIDRCEAETLFHKVREPSEEEYMLAVLIKPLVREGLTEEEPKVEFLTDDEGDDDEGDTDESGQETAAEPGEIPPTPRQDRGKAPGDGRTKSVRSDSPSGNENDAANGQDAEEAV